MTSQPWKKIILIYKLTNISRNKGQSNNEMTKIFLKKSFTKSGGETIPRPFFKKFKIEYIWINSLKFYTVCFNCMLS